jgi:hypothetical protein
MCAGVGLRESESLAALDSVLDVHAEGLQLPLFEFCGDWAYPSYWK